MTFQMKFNSPLMLCQNILRSTLVVSLFWRTYYFQSKSVRVLRDYPNSMYFLDFDFAIMAGGTIHPEAIQASLPTLCYPNMKTSTDDQLARAMVAHEAGCMIVLKDRRRTMVEAAIDRICDSEVRDNMKAKFKPLQRDNGATQISQWIVDNY